MICWAIQWARRMFPLGMVLWMLPSLPVIRRIIKNTTKLWAPSFSTLEVEMRKNSQNFLKMCCERWIFTTVWFFGYLSELRKWKKKKAFVWESHPKMQPQLRKTEFRSQHCASFDLSLNTSSCYFPSVKSEKNPTFSSFMYVICRLLWVSSFSYCRYLL